MAHRLSLRIVLMSTLASVLVPSLARAHWCDDLWSSSYNIVVKPATDAVTLDTSGNGQLDLYVQNNMGYPLWNFQIGASADGHTVKFLTQDQPKVCKEMTVGTEQKDVCYLMPGEKIRYTLSIVGSPSAAFHADLLAFDVNFGHRPYGQMNEVELDKYEVQGRYYLGREQGVMLKTATGTVPATPIPEVEKDNPQSLHLNNSADADYGDRGQALDALLAEYCAGRGSWDASGDPDLSYCPTNLDLFPTCPSSPSGPRSESKWDYQHLWAAGELAYRKDYLDAQRLKALRYRLKCGWNDNGIAGLTFKAFAGFVLAYLGPDAEAQSFFTGQAASGSAENQALAKAALFLMGQADQRGSVEAGLSSSVGQIKSMSAAVLGIVDKTSNPSNADSVVENYLIPAAEWTEPTYGTDNQGTAMLAAHLLNLVAWDRRGWAPSAGDTGEVSFYAGSGGTVPVDPTDPVDPGGTGDNSKKAVCGCNSGTAAFLSVFLFLLFFAAARRRIRKS